ncbi:MAG TPA: addiction module protein [Pirellula sp.]|nr:addiction module protein [Pirellula sp.]
MSISVPSEIVGLPASDKLELVGKIWDSLELGDIELSDEYCRILDERLNRYEANPTEGRSWKEVKAGVLERKKY